MLLLRLCEPDRNIWSVCGLTWQRGTVFLLWTNLGSASGSAGLLYAMLVVEGWRGISRVVRRTVGNLN